MQGMGYSLLDCFKRFANQQLQVQRPMHKHLFVMCNSLFELLNVPQWSHASETPPVVVKDHVEKPWLKQRNHEI